MHRSRDSFCWQDDYLHGVLSRRESRPNVFGASIDDLRIKISLLCLLPFNRIKAVNNEFKKPPLSGKNKHLER